MRTQQQANAINRVLKAHGLGTLEDPGIVEALGRIVEDPQHFTELLRACEPQLRREMYEAMRPHLRFKARPLEDYIIAAKEHAEAAELPVMDANGDLLPYAYMTVNTTVIEVPEFELWVQCHDCGKEGWFYGQRQVDAIQVMRTSGWAFDETINRHHLCPECLEQEGVSELFKPCS